MNNASKFYYFLCVFDEHKEGLPVINSTRDIDEVNSKLQDGFHPLLVNLEPNEGMYQDWELLKNQTNGSYKWKPCNSLVQYMSSYHDIQPKIFLNKNDESKNWKSLFSKKIYARGKTLSHPWGVYLIPDGLLPNSKVYVEEVLEDILLESFLGSFGIAKDGIATWTGEDLIFDQMIWDELTPSIIG